MTLSTNFYDVIIVGGSYAGLSAAMALGRSHRKVLIIDAGNPCNAQTPHSHNFLTQDGKTPAEISALAKEQVLQYPTVTLYQDVVTSAKQDGHKFLIKTQHEKTYTCKKLLLATGIKDEFPQISGFKECWGISVLHCPYCHGYEVSHKKLGVIANGDNAFDFVKMILNWSKDVVLLTNGPSLLTAEQSALLKRHNISTIQNALKNIVHDKGQLEKLEFENRESIDLQAVFSRVPFTHHTEIAKEIGCNFTEGNLLSVDEFGKTNIPGLYAAGDCCLPGRSVSLAVASGTKAGISINKVLIEEQILQ